MKRLLLVLLALIASLVLLAGVFPEQATRVAFGIERATAGLDYRQIRVDDTPWHYLDGGPDSGDTILLLHGFGGDKDNWLRFAKHLTDDYRVVAPDLPGFGESPREPGVNYSLRNQSDRVHAFAEALGLDRYHIVGHSMGGNIAGLYAYARPDQILSLGFVANGGISSRTRTEIERRLDRGENPLIVETPQDFDELLEVTSEKVPFIPWPAKGVLARRAMQDAPFHARLFEFLLDDDANLEPLLTEIEAPVFILWGDTDRILDVSSVEVMRQLLPNADVVIMEETGHLPILERPAETARHYLEFLASRGQD